MAPTHDDRPVRLDRRAFLKVAASLGITGGTSTLAEPAAALELPAPGVVNVVATVLPTSAEASGVLTVVAQATAPAELRVEAWRAGTTGSRLLSPWQPTRSVLDARRAHSAELRLPGAGTASTSGWYYLVRGRPPGGGSTSASPTQFICARPPKGQSSRVTFAFGSCLNPEPVGQPNSAVPVLRPLMAFNPLFLALIGDHGYPDFKTTQDYAGYVKVFQATKNHPDLLPISRRIPLYHAADDHDYGIDGAYRMDGPAAGAAGPGGPIKSFAAQAFADCFPANPWRDIQGRVSQVCRSWSIGEVDFFLVDNRRFRDPQLGGPGNVYFENGLWRSVLGRVQSNWLKRALLSSSAKVKVLFAPATFAWYWGLEERHDVLQYLRDHGFTGRLLICSGDKHNQAHLSWRSPAVDEFLCSPLRNGLAPLQVPPAGKVSADTCAVPYPPALPRLENGTNVRDSAGVVTIDTTVTPALIMLRVVLADGSTAYEFQG